MKQRKSEAGVLALALVFALAILLTGCTEQKHEANKIDDKIDDRHRLDIMDICFNRYIVFRDNITGVYYVGNVHGGVCVMTNADGTPYTGE